jgi:sugar phosphate isomerase/epimerase
MECSVSHDTVHPVKETGPFPLLATCWTTAGDAAPYPGQHASPLRLRDRIEAASRAGFAAFGILDFDLHVFLQDATLTELHVILRDNGMEFVELEFLTRWWTDGAERVQSDRARQFLFSAAEALSAHHVKVAPDLDDLSPPDIGFWAQQFHELGAHAQEFGTRVALEFMPFANVSTLDLAVRIASAAGHPASGLLLDMWHVERSGIDPAVVGSVPIDLVVAVELDDGMAAPSGDPYDDTCLRRLIPGSGEFRVVEFAAALMRNGWALPWGVEIISEKLRLLPLGELLPEVVAATNHQLSQAVGSLEAPHPGGTSGKDARDG